MDTATIEEINANEIINILSDIIQKHIMKSNEEKRGDYNEQKSSNIL